MKYRCDEKISQSQDVRNANVLKSWIQRWIWASYCNHTHIFKEIMEQKKPYSIHLQQGKHKGEPALIIGGGKSFDELAPLLEDWKGAIFAPESMAKACAYYGHKPEYVMVFDGHERVWQDFLKDFDWKGSTLVTHPCVAVELIEKWKEERLYYLMMHYSRLYKKPVGETLREIETDVKEQTFGSGFFELDQPTAYGFIQAQILNAGCVVNNSIQVAHFMGYDPLFLCGVDFGFKDWVMRADKVEQKDGKWKVSPAGIVKHKEGRKKKGDVDLAREIVFGKNGIPSTEEQIEYKTALMSVYKLDRPQLIDCSDGIITELPKASILEVVKRNGQGFEGIYRTSEEIVSVANDYLCRR